MHIQARYHSGQAIHFSRFGEGFFNPFTFPSFEARLYNHFSKLFQLFFISSSFNGCLFYMHHFTNLLNTAFDQLACCLLTDSKIL